LSNINDVLQAFRVCLLNEAAMSQMTAVEQDAMWATFELMLLQSPAAHLNCDFLRARKTLEEFHDDTLVKQLVAERRYIEN
jgi:hypothetical protein